MDKLIISLLLVLTTMLGAGCSQLPGPLGSFFDSDTTVNFVIDDIGAARQSGGVSLRGTASLPDGTEVTVSAVRVLDVSSSGDRFSESTPYAILDRQFIPLEDGQWQAELALRQLDAANASFENWQFSEDLRLETRSPSQNVLFLAMIEPENFEGEVGEILNAATINGGDTQLSFTADGEPYLLVSQSMAIPVPSGSVVKAENTFRQGQYQDLWQDRANYSPRVDGSQEFTQLPFMEQDNLPLPLSNLMQ